MLDPRRGRGLYNTYSVFVPLFRYPPDHFFYSRHFGLVRMEKLSAFGSDHYPVMIEVVLKTSEEFSNGLSEADQSDEEEVEEVIEERREKDDD